MYSYYIEQELEELYRERGIPKMKRNNCKLFSVKPKTNEPAVYHVAAAGYDSAVQKYKEKLAHDSFDGIETYSLNQFEAAMDQIPDPEKVCIVSDEGHFIP
jgi:hypothetical protein